MTPRFLEDFKIDEVIRHRLGRTILAADNTWFTLLTMNTNPLHFDEHGARASDHGRPLVNSGFTLALILGLTVADMSQHAIANLGWREIRLLEPVFVGDTLYAESKVVAVRASRSKPDRGILTCYSRGMNQDGVTVLDFERTVMVPTRAASPSTSFPEPSVGIHVTHEALRRHAERSASAQ